MDVVIFTCVSGIFFQRSIGAYQIANFLRQNGYTVQIIDFTDYFTSEELLTVSEKFITDQTLAVGISTTFYQESNDDKSKFLHNGKNKFELNEFPENVLTPILKATSSMRLEKPHSLSYHPKTRTRPNLVTRVSGRAIRMLSGRARKSDETSGASVVPMTPPAARSFALI
jgi:hypothetical protein